MRTTEDIVQELKHKGYHFVAAVRKGPDEFPRFVIFEDPDGRKAVLMFSGYEQGELLLPSETFAPSPGGDGD